MFNKQGKKRKNKKGGGGKKTPRCPKVLLCRKRGKEKTLFCLGDLLQKGGKGRRKRKRANAFLNSLTDGEKKRGAVSFDYERAEIRGEEKEYVDCLVEICGRREWASCRIGM